MFSLEHVVTIVVGDGEMVIVNFIYDIFNILILFFSLLGSFAVLLGNRSTRCRVTNLEML